MRFIERSDLHKSIMHISYIPGGQGESGHNDSLHQPNSFSSSSSGMQSASIGHGSMNINSTSNAGHSMNAGHQLGVMPSSPGNVGLLTSASRVPIWKIAKQDWAKLFGYVLEHNMNTKKPKQIFSCLSILGIPIKGTEKAFRGKWCLHRSKLEKFALLYIEARRGDLRDMSLETIKSTSGVRKYTRIYSDPVTALSLGLHIIKEKQRRAAKDAIMIAALQTLDKNNPVVSNGMHYDDDDESEEESSGEMPDDDDSLDDDDLAGVMGIPPPPTSSSSSSKKKRSSSSAAAAAAASSASPLSHLNLSGNEKRSSRKRENEDITAKASSALAEMRRIPPLFASPQHNKRNKVDPMMNNNNGGGGLMSNQVMGQDHLAFDDRYGFLGSLQPSQVNNMPQQQSPSSSSSTLKKKLDDLSHAILKANDRLTALEAGFQKITNLEKKLDHLLDRILRSAASKN